MNANITNNRFEFSKLIEDELTMSEIKLIKGYVSYRIHRIGTEENYSGHSENLYNRLYNKLFGHATYMNRTEDNMDYVHICMNKIGYNNFELIIEGIFDTLEEAKAMEDYIARKYKCFEIGYNKTQSGNGGAPVGSKVIYNPDTGECRYLHPNEDINKYINLGWLNTNKLNGRITMEDDNFNIVIIDKDLESNYSKLGYHRLSWTGSSWIKNIKTNKYSHIRSKDELNELLSTGLYIMEAPTKDRINVYDKLSCKFRKIPRIEYECDSMRYEMRSPYEGSVIMINVNTGDIRKVYKDSMDEFISLGYTRYKKIGKYTLFNPETGKQTTTYTDKDKLLSMGWRLGKCNHSGKTFMNDGKSNITVPFNDELKKMKLLSKGYKFGKIK